MTSDVPLFILTLLSSQTAASQQDSKLRELTSRVAKLEQQLSDTKALKTAAENERDSAIREKNETKVCAYTGIRYNAYAVHNIKSTYDYR